MSIIRHNYNGFGGIYRITNKKNDKSYIGQTVSFATRWKSHKRMLNDGTHHNSLLSKDWIDFGSESFEFSVIEELDPVSNLLNSREYYWANHFDSLNPKKGYNLAVIGDCNVLFSAPCRRIPIGEFYVLERTTDNYLFATGLASQFGKEIGHFMEIKTVKEYSYYIDSDSRNKYKGTWIHPDFFFFFARWVDVKFAIYYNRKFLSQIESSGDTVQDLFDQYQNIFGNCPE